MTEPPAAPPDDTWPVADEPTVVSTRDTVVGAPPPEPVGPPPPDRRIGAGMLLALGALALVAIGLVIAYLLSQRNDKQTTTVVVTTPPAAAAKVSVPRLIGLQEQVALDRLSQAGLQPKEVFKPTDKPRRTVVDQKPKEATQVAKGSQVTLVIDSAAATGSSTTTSATTTTNDTTTTTSTSETTTSAATTATTPATPANATVPDVSGQAEQAAVTSFATAGVLASLVFVPSQDPLGTVVQQAKPSGTSVPYHAHVQLNLSRGPGEKPDVSVPDAVGQTLTQAVSTMNGAGLRLIFVKLPVTSAAQVGKIAQQSPLAGGKAPRNAQVLVFLGVKPS